MANKREFKKTVEAIGASIYEEMMTSYYNVKDIDKDAVSKAIAEVLGATASARNNANVFFDKGMRAFADHKEYSKAKAAFFKKLFEKIDSDFNARIDNALKMFNAALPAEAKELNKKLAAE